MNKIFTETSNELHEVLRYVHIAIKHEPHNKKTLSAHVAAPNAASPIGCPDKESRRMYQAC